jgi:hypothetical protein
MCIVCIVCYYILLQTQEQTTRVEIQNTAILYPCITLKQAPGSEYLLEYTVFVNDDPLEHAIGIDYTLNVSNMYCM